MIHVAPLLSSEAIPEIGKMGLALFTSIVVYPWIYALGIELPKSIVDYFLLVVGELLIGIIIGFFLALIYIAFQLAGQFFSLQMGFGASSVFDPLAQIEVPLMGQLFNLIGMLAFLSIGGFQKLFLCGVYKSFQSIRASNLVSGKGFLLNYFIGSLGRLFESAMTIALPILGTLFIVSVCMGLLAKAAPQMNLLLLGFPIAIGVAFLILFFFMPFLFDACAHLIELSFKEILKIFEGVTTGR
jgi:flagellar biosynthetic protein FliR